MDPHFRLIIGLYLPSIFCVLGSVGNAICLYVLSHSKGNDVTLYSLRALATCDLALLIAAFAQQIVPLVCYVLESTSSLCLNVGYIQVYAWPVVCMAQMGSIWLTVVISAERQRAICQPLKFNSTQMMFVVRKSVMGITICTILFNIPKFFEFCAIPVNLSNMTHVIVGEADLRTNIIYRYLYYISINTIVVYVIPFILLFYLNGSILYVLEKVKRSWPKSSKQYQQECKATTVPLAILVVFFLCETPAFLSFILDAIYVDQRCLWIQYYTVVANLFIVFKSAINLVIFYLFGSKFRKMLSECMPHCSRSEFDHIVKEPPQLLVDMCESDNVLELHENSPLQNTSALQIVDMCESNNVLACHEHSPLENTSFLNYCHRRPSYTLFGT